MLPRLFSPSSHRNQSTSTEFTLLPFIFKCCFMYSTATTEADLISIYCADPLAISSP